jgi:hypothetical protein
MSGQTHQPPTRSRRARLAARGILPYEPSAVYAAAFCGILLVLASGGDGWFEEWKMLLRQASEQPGDLSALATSGRRLLLHSVGSLVGVSLLCGWGVGWMQRRLSPPAATRWDGLLVTAALSAWRHRRFDLEQAMSHAEVAEERRAEEGAGATKNEVAARRAGRG